MSTAISRPSKATEFCSASLRGPTAVIAILCATFGLTLRGPVPAFAGEPLSILGYTKSVSFWMNIPPGSRSDAAAARRTGAIFILVPAHYTFDNAPAVIVASAYRRATLAAAMAKDRASFKKDDPHIHITDRSAIVAKAGGKFLVREFRSHLLKEQGYECVTYHQEGPDTIVITLSAQTASQYHGGLRVFFPFVETYDVSPLKVTVEQ